MEKETIEFLKLAGERYSVRKFSDQPITKEVLDQIIQAGYLAPTACNLQPQRVVVITDEEAREKLKKCTRFHFDAPAAMLICYNKEECWKRRYDGKSSGDVDASIVMTHMMLEAWALGIGSTIVMSFDPQTVRQEFSLPEAIEPVVFLMLGHPAEDAAPYPGHTEFRPLNELIVQNHF